MRLKQLAAAVLAMLLALGAACAQADSEGRIVQSSCSIVRSGEYYLVYCFAQVHNDSEEVICLEQGTFELHSGEQLLASQPVTQLWPYFINPGEDGYVFDVVAFEPGESGAVVPAVTDLVYDIQYMTVNTQYASRDLSAVAELERGDNGELRVICHITNGTEVDAFAPTIAFGLYAENGGMLYADGTTLQNVGIPAGGTLLMRFPVDEDFVAQWDTYGMSAAEARVSAAFRNDED